jgi:DNA-binding NarL/FixJ family response regulator
VTRHEAPRIVALVIAGSPALRAGLASLLAEDPGIHPTASALRDVSPDVLVVDAPDAASIPADAAAAWPNLPIVLLGAGFAPDTLDHARPVAWLNTDADAAMLSAAVRAVAAGLTVLDPERAALPRLQVADPAEGVAETLTAREREVLALVADGLPNKAIARELGISEHTAKFHVGSLLGKLNAGSRAEAVAIATRRGILSV